MIQQHHPYAGTIGQILMPKMILARHEQIAAYLLGGTMAEAGTRTKPRPGNPCAQAASRSIVIG
jgi:hypothetical protein